ncbi:hypothetical protein ACVWZ6_001462 [Bradyrhizobium sp. GM6.1]
MTFDTYLGIGGLALAAASLVPIFTARQVKYRVIGVAVLLVAALILIGWHFQPGESTTSQACPASLPPHDAGPMGGGHTQEGECGPQRDTYKKQYPACDVTMNVSEENNKDDLGHATYVYHCTYAITPKAK